MTGVVSQGFSERVIDAGPGDDRIVGRAEGLVVHAGDGDDDVQLSGNGAGQVFAGPGADRVHGSAGGDYGATTFSASIPSSGGKASCSPCSRPPRSCTRRFHPKDNFRDAESNLHLCFQDEEGHELTCVDEAGWGVCRRCGTADGETMLGCSCTSSNDCSAGGELLEC